MRPAYQVFPYLNTGGRLHLFKSACQESAVTLTKKAKTAAHLSGVQDMLAKKAAWGRSNSVSLRLSAGTPSIAQEVTFAKDANPFSDLGANQKAWG
jgi:hypothetical protein